MTCGRSTSQFTRSAPENIQRPLPPTNLPQHRAPTGDKRTVRNQGAANDVPTTEKLRQADIKNRFPTAPSPSYYLPRLFPIVNRYKQLLLQEKIAFPTVASSNKTNAHMRDVREVIAPVPNP